jgi:hypothetical protein
VTTDQAWLSNEGCIGSKYKALEVFCSDLPYTFALWFLKVKMTNVVYLSFDFSHVYSVWLDVCVVLKFEHVSKSPTGLKTQITSSASGFWFSRSGLGSKNLHFQQVSR